MVLLGAAVPMLGIEYDAIKEAVRKIFSRKGEEIVNSNLAALDAGYQYSIESTK
jgi:indolepyruvate ferredoxin oxidoreductase beta subunit